MSFSLEEATDIIKLLILKIKEIEEREPVRDQRLVEEILHLRRETREGFQQLREELVEKIDNNTLAIKGLEGKFDSMESTMEEGFENVAKILQEISNKLDK